MATFMQLIKKTIRKEQVIHSRVPILLKKPQRHGVCTKVYKMTPKKPCSARRSVAWVLFISGSVRRGALCHIPGETHNLRVYSRVLVRGGRVKDLPGVRCRIIRSSKTTTSDLHGLYKRRKACSVYGTRNVFIVHNIRLYRHIPANSDFWALINPGIKLLNPSHVQRLLKFQTFMKT